MPFRLLNVATTIKWSNYNWTVISNIYFDCVSAIDE